MQLDADIHLCGDIILVRCRGQIIFGDEPMRIARRIRRLGSPIRKVVLDLAAVKAVNTSDLGPLIIYYLGARAAGYRIALTRVPDYVMSVLTSTGTAELFEIHDNPEAAGRRSPDEDTYSQAVS